MYVPTESRTQYSIMFNITINFPYHLILIFTSIFIPLLILINQSCLSSGVNIFKIGPLKSQVLTYTTDYVPHYPSMSFLFSFLTIKFVFVKHFVLIVFLIP